MSRLEDQIAMAPWLRYARECLGIREEPGARDNETIVKWIAACAPNRPWLAHDATPHCAAFVGACLRTVGIEGTGSLAARSYLRWGVEVAQRDARMGDVVVLWRGAPLPKSVINAPGHVAFLDRIVGNQALLLGANQRNRVAIDPYPLRRVLSFRRPTADDMKLHDLLRGSA